MLFEGLAFLSPWVLTALAAVPVLWWLLRAMPPRPRTVRFPTFFLLKGIAARLKTAAHTPWWLLLLRSLVVVLFIIAFADPVLHPAQDLPGGNKGNVLIVIDNGWASAGGWKERQGKLKEYLRQIRRSGRSIIFLPTAPGSSDGRVEFFGPIAADQAEAWADRLKPRPWPDSHREAAQVVEKIVAGYAVTYSMFLSDGISAATEETRELLGRVQTLVTDDAVNNPHILRQVERKTGEMVFSLERLHAVPGDESLQVLAYSDAGAIVDEMKVVFPGGKTEHEFSWDMPQEVRNQALRLALRMPEMASAVFLAQAQWRRHAVGIVADAQQKESRDFLNEVYYLRRALETHSQLTIDTLEALLKTPVSALVLADSAPLTAADKADLMAWVEQGGFLIRFAGPNLAANTEDALLPVPLRSGQRALEGAMTWEKPVRLAAIAAQSPLYGLTASPDITVTRQVLADPTPEVFEKTWLQLEDGTPLMTGGKMGKGTIALVHTSAGPEWSNFCYSGLFVESLQRMVSLSNGIREYQAPSSLPPLLLLDGFGRLFPPDEKTVATSVKPEEIFAPSPQTPPGIYGDMREFRAFNLGDYLLKMQSLKDIPSSVTVVPYQKTGEIDLKSVFLKGALLLLLLDTLATFWLRGVLALAAVSFLIMLSSNPVLAAEDEKALVSGIYLAYIETGDQDIDRVSYNGLTGLAAVLGARTTAKVSGVAALNPDSDPLAYYPVIYWPMAEQQLALSVTAARNVQNYLSRGGLILFDTSDQQFGGDALGARKLRELTQSLQIPELIPIPKDHILTRSFYLLEDFPGRYTGGKLWVEKEPNPRHDAVTSVIIGSNDWAAAWSMDAADQARFAVDSGGESRRETAYRFGVNLVMMALTGNYKADQVHVPYILNRIDQ